LIKSYFKEIEKEYCIHWADENEPLGTGGGLSLLKNKLKDTFFFICCDSLILTDYSEIVEFHKKNRNDITMICARKKVVIPYGIVNEDKDVLTSIEEKPEFSFLTNTAMYLIEPSVLKDMKKNTRIDFPDFIKEEKEKGKKIGVYTVDEDDWLDMGQMSELEKMRIRLYGE
jgi:NDP-sugar pyrophosphorylase family protein